MSTSGRSSEGRSSVVRKLIAEAEGAVSLELALEGRPDHQEAVRRAARAEARLERAVETLLAKPAKSFADLVTLAGVARHLHADDADRVHCLDDRILVAIARGLLSLADDQ